MKLQSSNHILILVGLFLSIYISNVNAASFQKITIMEIVQDTIIDKFKSNPTEWTSKITSQEGDKKVEIETRNGEVTNLQINGITIPKEEYGEYDDIIRKNTKMNGLKSRPLNGSDFPFGSFGMQNFKSFGDSSKVFKFRIQDIDSIFGESGFKMGEGGNFELKLNQLFNNPMGDSIFSKMFDRTNGLGEGSMPEGFEGLFNFSRPLRMEMDENGLSPKQQFDNNRGGIWKDNGKSKNLEQLLGEQLNKDGLLTPEKENKIELNGKYLRINGQKMPQVTFEKYKSLFEIETGMPLNQATTLAFKMIGKSAERQFKAF